MSMTDPIADMLTRIRNAVQRRRETVEMPTSNMRQAIAQILQNEGFVQRYEVLGDRIPQTLRVHLKYGPNRERVIEGLRRISKPGCRVYAGREEMPRVRNGLGFAVISTSQGILTERECRRRGIGGEVLCYVW